MLRNLQYLHIAICTIFTLWFGTQSFHLDIFSANQGGNPPCKPTQSPDCLPSRFPETRPPSACLFLKSHLAAENAHDVGNWGSQSKTGRLGVASSKARVCDLARARGLQGARACRRGHQAGSSSFHRAVWQGTGCVLSKAREGGRTLPSTDFQHLTFFSALPPSRLGKLHFSLI